jgi:carnitine 3-dehydrogenase
MKLQEPTQVRRVTVVGTGVIGRGWIAHFLRQGLDVTAYNRRASAEGETRKAIEMLWPTMERLGLSDGADPDRLTFTTSVKEALCEADFVQENGPENTELKIDLFAELDEWTKPHVVIASSTSGIPMTTIQQRCKNPARCIVGLPYTPSYLIPVVEVVSGTHTAPEVTDWAMAFYKAMGKRPIRIKKEVPGFIANRLLESLWREALHMVADGQATVEQIDIAISYGFGMRWAIFGPFMVYHLGGGEGGIEHFLDHFAPALKLPWTHMEAPELTQELRDRVVQGTLEEAGDRSIQDLEKERDNCLIEIMKVLDKIQGRGILSKTCTCSRC